MKGKREREKQERKLKGHPRLSQSFQAQHKKVSMKHKNPHYTVTKPVTCILYSGLPMEQTNSTLDDLELWGKALHMFFTECLLPQFECRSSSWILNHSCTLHPLVSVEKRGILCIHTIMIVIMASSYYDCYFKRMAVVKSTLTRYDSTALLPHNHPAVSYILLGYLLQLLLCNVYVLVVLYYTTISTCWLLPFMLVLVGFWYQHTH